MPKPDRTDVWTFGPDDELLAKVSFNYIRVCIETYVLDLPGQTLYLDCRANFYIDGRIRQT